MRHSQISKFTQPDTQPRCTNLSSKLTQRTDRVERPRDGRLSWSGRPVRSHRRGCRPGCSGSTGGWSGGRRRRRFLENEVLEAHLMHARESVHCAFQRSHGLVKDLVSWSHKRRTPRVRSNDWHTPNATMKLQHQSHFRKPRAHIHTTTPVT